MKMLRVLLRSKCAPFDANRHFYTSASRKAVQRLSNGAFGATQDDASAANTETGG